jgi:hypothetical protein
MNHHIETDVIETQGKAYGVEVMLKRSLGRLNGWLSIPIPEPFSDKMTRLFPIR